MQHLIQQKPYRFSAPNNDNNLQDFDSTPELPAGAYAEIF